MMMMIQSSCETNQWMADELELDKEESLCGTEIMVVLCENWNLIGVNQLISGNPSSVLDIVTVTRIAQVGGMKSQLANT